MTLTLFSGHYLRNRSTLDIGVLGYIGIVYHKEHSPEVSHIPSGTPRIVGILRLYGRPTISAVSKEERKTRERVRKIPRLQRQQSRQII